MQQLTITAFTPLTLTAPSNLPKIYSLIYFFYFLCIFQSSPLDTFGNERLSQPANNEKPHSKVTLAVCLYPETRCYLHALVCLSQCLYTWRPPSSSSRWHTVWCQYRTPEGMRKSTQMVCVSCLRCPDLFIVHFARQHFHLYDGDREKKIFSHEHRARLCSPECEREGISGIMQWRSGHPQRRQSSRRAAPTCGEQRAVFAGLH